MESPHKLWTLEFLDLSLYPWKFQAKWSFFPGNSTKLCYTHWNFQGQKPRPMEIPHDFFLITNGSSTSFFIDPWNFHILFFQYPWKLYLPLCLFFFCNSPINYNVTVLSPCNCTVALSSWPCAVAALKIYVAILICFVNKKGRLL